MKWLDEHFEELLLTICLLLILFVSFAQVVIRKLPNVSALTWAEEFCRFLWIFSVFLSLPYCLKKGSMLQVDLLGRALPRQAAKALGLFRDVCVFLAMCALAAASVRVVRMRFSSGELSPAMLWPVWILYAVMLAGYVLAAIRALQMLFARMRRGGER